MSSFSNDAAGPREASRPEAREQGTTATATSKSDPFQTEEYDQIDHRRSDADGKDGRDDEDDEDAEDGPDYNWEPNGTKFLRSLGQELGSASPAPPELSFSEHQRYWRAKFDSLIQKIRNDGTADTQLTEPPIKAFEIEIVDCRSLDEHGCGQHCPCDLDSTRSVKNKVFTLSHDTGLTNVEFLEQLRDTLYIQEDQAQYSVAQDVFVGNLNVTGFNFMISSGDIWSAARKREDYEQELPCVYVEVDGIRKQTE